MTVEYAIKVARLDVYPESEGRTDVVYRAFWTMSATDGVSTYTAPGQTDIPYNPDDHWTDYPDLIEDEVIEWISKHDAVKTSALRASLALNFPVSTTEENKPLPWG